MTRGEARQAAKIMKAWANGEELEFRQPDSVLLGFRDWTDVMGECFFNWEKFDYRIKDPKKRKVVRPWSSETCPLRCGDVLQHKERLGEFRSVVAIKDGLFALGGAADKEQWFTPSELKKWYLFEDKPCGELVEKE